MGDDFRRQGWNATSSAATAAQHVHAKVSVVNAINTQPLRSLRRRANVSELQLVDSKIMYIIIAAAMTAHPPCHASDRQRTRHHRQQHRYAPAALLNRTIMMRIRLSDSKYAMPSPIYTEWYTRGQQKDDCMGCAYMVAKERIYAPV
jgi:hypothetical protein